METKRCAIYTRKSVDDGLAEQDFNSLDAQREAGENYIASQKSNGWICLPERYDDGGWSGGNIERPALKRLLDDIKAGKLDIIVVYKIDRLSRSLLDFSELQTLFDANKVSFVSVTQEINTSTSAGRMMLNILMTFAQYEREIIAERIKDKVAGAKKRGKYCGGTPVLGYSPDSKLKKLNIVEHEAQTVRLLFEKYLTHRSLKPVVSEANMLGLKTKEWVAVSGRKHEAKSWDTGNLYRVLSNPIYAGLVRHYDTIYMGEHAPIITRETWEQVQNIMRANGCQGPRQHSVQTQPLAGLVKCGHCRRALTPTYTKRHGKKYCYYICQAATKNPDHICPLKRIPSGDLEQAVMKQLSGLFRTPAILGATLSAIRQKELEYRQNLECDRDLLEAQLTAMKNAALNGETDFEELKRCHETLAEVKRQLAAIKKPLQEAEVIAALSDTAGLWEFLFPAARHELLHLTVREIAVYENRIAMMLKVDGLKELAMEMSAAGYFSIPHADTDIVETKIEQEVMPDGAIQLTMPLTVKSIDGHRRVVIPAPGSERLKANSILRAIRNAQKWAQMLIDGEAKNVSDLAMQLNLKSSYVTRILNLNNLAPDIVEAIYRGEEPEGLSLARLVKGIPDDWSEQRKVLRF